MHDSSLCQSHSRLLPGLTVMSTSLPCPRFPKAGAFLTITLGGLLLGIHTNGNTKERRQSVTRLLDKYTPLTIGHLGYMLHEESAREGKRLWLARILGSRP